MNPRTIVFAANRGYALTSSRAPLIQHFLSGGWRVVLATAEDKESHSLCDLGAVLEPVVFDRGGFSPLADPRAFWRLRSIYSRWRPALIQHFHAKPVILGTLAARGALGKSVRVINAITGLGHAFITGGLSARLAGLGYAAGVPRSDTVIFQNRDDRQLFLERGWVPKSGVQLIAGSGVDLHNFTFAERGDRGDRAPVIVMLARLLRQKGILEFSEVAGSIRQRWPEARFILAGEEDPAHPDAITGNWIHEQKDVEYLGRLRDVRPLLAEADLLLFPSYREGTPRVILEAAATGLATVAFDVPGVREAVRHGETGYLVPDRDVDALTGRVAELLESRDKRVEMGISARRLVEDQFDIQAIKERYLCLYRDLGVAV